MLKFHCQILLEIFRGKILTENPLSQNETQVKFFITWPISKRAFRYLRNIFFNSKLPKKQRKMKAIRTLAMIKQINKTANNEGCRYYIKSRTFKNNLLPFQNNQFWSKILLQD